jgi:hypothetical protein
MSIAGFSTEELAIFSIADPVIAGDAERII